MGDRYFPADPSPDTQSSIQTSYLAISLKARTGFPPAGRMLFVDKPGKPFEGIGDADAKRGTADANNTERTDAH